MTALAAPPVPAPPTSKPLSRGAKLAVTLGVLLLGLAAGLLLGQSGGAPASCRAALGYAEDTFGHAADSLTALSESRFNDADQASDRITVTGALYRSSAAECRSE